MLRTFLVTLEGLDVFGLVGTDRVLRALRGVEGFGWFLCA